MVIGGYDNAHQWYGTQYVRKNAVCVTLAHELVVPGLLGETLEFEYLGPGLSTLQADQIQWTEMYYTPLGVQAGTPPAYLGTAYPPTVPDVGGGSSWVVPFSGAVAIKGHYNSGVWSPTRYIPAISMAVGDYYHGAFYIKNFRCIGSGSG